MKPIASDNLCLVGLNWKDHHNTMAVSRMLCPFAGELTDSRSSCTNLLFGVAGFLYLNHEEVTRGVSRVRDDVWPDSPGSFRIHFRMAEVSIVFAVNMPSSQPLLDVNRQAMR
jgi:hypothetical protein